MSVHVCIYKYMDEMKKLGKSILYFLLVLNSMENVFFLFCVIAYLEYH